MGARTGAALGAALLIAASMLVWGGLTVAAAQDSRAILADGDAVVTGFSGVRPPETPLPANVNPIDRTYIDLDRPSARIVNLVELRGAPAAQHVAQVAASKPFSVNASQIGQVFSIALDDATPPNIYLAATSVYGLPIVVPDRDGDGRPDRSRRGAPFAAFMPGLFGPVTAKGGPGSIWKVDGRTGAVTLFANVLLDGVPNSGPALGGLAFDPGSRQLFVADRDTGMIHRFGLDGIDRGRFDHGTTAFPAAGLPAVAFDPRNRLDLTSSNFDSGNPATWAYAPSTRRVFALAVRGGRLFYSVAADVHIWSVSIARDGGFGTDPRLELAVPSARSGTEISNIVFDDAGHMIIAERGAPTGAYDYGALAQAGENRVLRLRPRRTDDPPGPGLWHAAPEEYAIGFPPNHRNGNGGVALGYGYGANGAINRAVCAGTLWSTGEQLRNASDPAIVTRLQAGGPLVVNGLQGNTVSLIRPQNAPPFGSYFVDFDERFDDASARGHLGDVEIWRVCPQAATTPPMAPLAVTVVCPQGWLNVRGVCVTGPNCPHGTEFADGRCGYQECPASYVRVDGRCVPPPIVCKPDETFVGGRCEPATCPPGLVRTTPTNGMTRPDGGAYPEYCGCPDGSAPDSNGVCQQTPPPRVGLCPSGTTWECRDDPKFGCQCVAETTPETPPSRTITCPSDTTKVCRGQSEDERLDCGCIPGTPPPAAECSFPNVLVGDVCCTQRDFQAGTCGATPTGPPPLPELPRMTIRPIPAEDTRTPIEHCPSWAQMVRGTCCFYATSPASCYFRSPGGIGTSVATPGTPECRPSYSLVGVDLCCSSTALRCSARAPGAACAAPAFAVVDDTGLSACCVREETAGKCDRPPSVPTQGPLPSGPNMCRSDNECPANARCERGDCVLPPPPRETDPCPGTSIQVNGVCCAAEAVAAGTCGPAAACTDGKVLDKNVCRCPAGTVENASTGRCEIDRPRQRTTAPAKSAPTKTAPTKSKPEIVCQKGFHREGNRCVADSPPRVDPGFTIQFGIGIGGGRSGGGGPKSPPIQKPQ